MKHVALIILLATIAATAAGVARADALKGDPRKCVFNNPTQCAHDAAGLTLIAYMAAKTHDVSWDAVITCTRTGPTLFKWRCTFKNGVVSGTAKVWFRALSTGWKRVVTVTTTPATTTTP